jgi:predicted aspartyl protease
VIIPIIILLVAAPAASPSPPPVTRFETVATPQPTDGNAPDTIALSADSFDRLTVPVRLAGAGPFRFLIDTGADRTAISTELARKLGLAGAPTALLHSATGASQVAMVVIADLTISHQAVQRIDAPLLAAAFIGADGILGIDSLRAQRILFDFPARTLSITSSSERNPLDEEGVIVVRAQRREGRLVITDAAADGKHVSVVIDTGSQYSIGNAALRAALERRGRVVTVGAVELVSVTGAILPGELVIVRELEIGHAVITNLALVFADAHTFKRLDLDGSPAILLGMNGLRSFNKVSIDFETKKLRLLVSEQR